ncbi:unnamed protein product [Orchesella dallaii]|uniref:Proteasome inhibitor PI31 subunit n=1 Tax=Orchesella dallaii TaxID=48710 RepID=A0ABP1RDB2_9HEXA
MEVAKKQESVFPAGFELLFKSCYTPNLTSFECMVLPIHWAVVRNSDFRIVKDDHVTESLENLKEMVQDEDEEEIPTVEIKYVDVITGSNAVLKILEVAKDAHIAVAFTRDSCKTTVSAMDTLDYVVNAEGEGVFQVYKPHNFQKLESLVTKTLLGRIQKRETKTENPGTSPYESKISESDKEAKKREDDEKSRLEAERSRQAKEPNPHGGGVGFIPPMRGIVPPGIGRSDLDPFGGAGSGMLMDPRGFRGGGVRQPRFDPIGPVPPGGVFGPRRGGAAPNFPFGGPDPDHERVPDGFNDMFM